MRKYFDSVPHGVLKRLLARRFKDQKVRSILGAIIDSYSTSAEHGIPIGNFSSRHFANFLLGYLDHFTKETLRVRCYLRYMDDMVVFGSTKPELDIVLDEVRRFSANLLGLELKPPAEGRVEAGLPFLGFLVKPSGIYLSRRKKRRSAARIAEYVQKLEGGEWSEEELADHILPVCAHLCLARSRTFRNTLFSRSGLGLEPGESRRQLEQRRVQRAHGQPQQQRPDEPERQPGLPPGAPQLTETGFGEPAVSGSRVAPRCP